MKVIISGGGTGGHIFPAIAIAGAIRKAQPEAEILFVGAQGRMEMERVPAAGYRIVGLPVRGFFRPLYQLKNFGVLWDLMKSQRLARRTLREFRPDVVVGVGGYASGPTLNMAYKMGIPCVVQEQNSYAGVTNKLLAQKAALFCVAYEGMERFFPAEKIVLTGNPVREALLSNTETPAEARKHLGLDPERPTVLVIGGSLGARTVNESIAAGIERLEQAGVQVLWQTGKIYADRCREQAEATGTKLVHPTAFIADMAEAYRAADVVISRAGASSISELCLLAKAAILVPSPNVAEDHQTKNARALSDRDAAVFVSDAEAGAKLVDEALKLVADADRRQTLEVNIGKMALRNSAEQIAQRVIALAQQKQ
jgi:UDP-N-acetylglucosamine--N-acetylmuramyl-(pentapeptide) pyrophosphoryl-undecaprenol N-acetylglucosamine transferase